MVRVSTPNKAVRIGAQVLRAAYALALEPILPEVRDIAQRYRAIQDEDKRQAAREVAIERSGVLATVVLRRYRSNLAFVLAHELGHEYGGTSEESADCYGVANVLDAENDADAGLFPIIVDDFVRRRGELWTEDTSGAGAALLRRQERITDYTAFAHTNGTTALRSLCQRLSPLALQ